MFRKVHPNEQSFTYHSGLRRSRIDKIYGNFKNNVESAQHIPVYVRIRTNEKPRIGKGFWKLNTSLLGDEKTRVEIIRFWQEWKGKKKILIAQ
jgi:hypothetical protein